MDWNLKATSWDLTEFEQGAVPSISIDAFDRSTNFGVNRSGGGFSIDLKLGRVGNSSDESIINWKQPGVSKLQPLPSGSTKRARGANSGTQVAMCLVDGCNSDLSTCRDYHRRHKVCELHSKTPQVTVGGQRQRFCQQCSRGSYCMKIKFPYHFAAFILRHGFSTPHSVISVKNCHVV